MILDTSFLIDLLRNSNGASEKAREVEARGEQLATTTISIFELWRGLSLESEFKLLQANRLIEQLKQYSLDPSSAKNAGRIARELDKDGLIIESEDCMIAGISRQHKEVLLTRNTKHFSRISGLQIEIY